MATAILDVEVLLSSPGEISITKMRWNVPQPPIQPFKEFTNTVHNIYTYGLAFTLFKAIHPLMKSYKLKEVRYIHFKGGSLQFRFVKNC